MFKQYHNYLKSHLTPPRYTHSLGVMRVMGDLADIYAIDREQAIMAGLLHDIAKDMPPTTMLTLAEQASIPFAHPCERHPMYLHGPVGAYLANTKLGIDNTLILDAIRTHTDHSIEYNLRDGLRFLIFELDDQDNVVKYYYTDD